MGTSLSSPALRIGLLAALLLAAGTLIFQAIEIWLADTRLQSGQIDQMEKGAALLPENADAWDRLGRYYMLTFSDPNPSLAIADLERAVKVDPHSEDYWLDLASAYDSSGNDAAAKDAYDHARDVYPTSALVAWNYGNYLLREDKQTEGYEEIQHAVVGNPLLLPLAMSRVWHATGDANQLLDHVIPPNVDSYIQALNFFGSIHQMQAGLIVWKRLIGLKQPVRLATIFPFMDELIREDDSDDSRRMWNEAVLASGDSQLSVTEDSLVSDGSFQSFFPYGGLGWRWDATPGGTIDFDSLTPSGRGRSIRVDFSGGVNPAVNMPSQYVAVEPGHAYHFHASMHTEEITTDSGMRFAISDPNHNTPNLETENFTGTQPWAAVDLDLSAGPQTHFFLIRLFREPSKFFENKLGGTVWIADVSLVPANSPASQPPR